MAKKLTTEDFILKAKEIHGDKYDYSKAIYVSSNTKVIIIFPIHGEFEQTPNAHLRGKGCPHCGNIFKGKKFKLTTEQFISKAKKIHGNKYDYSKVDYINNTTKVCIICPKHGEFWQRPVDHYKNRGCKLCDKEKIKLSTEKFIEKARKIHGDKYDYSKVNYVNCKTKVTIICPIHGEFKQTPSGHLEGKGCYNCFKYKKLTKEEFIDKAKLIHGNKYDYSKVNYIDSKTKVCIICPIHGEFWQNTSSHLRGCGCKSCHFSVLEKNIKHFLIDNNIEFEIQKKFDWLGKQSLDFYLPIYNIAIECQGVQHFKKHKFFGGEDAYIDRIKRDKRKYNLCKENKIKLLYFTNVNENLIPKSYFDTIYSNKNDLLNAIKEYGIDTRT